MLKWVLLLVLSSSPALGSSFTDKILDINNCIPFSVTSWIRSSSRNEAVGGVANSKHLKGLAVDIVLDHREDAPHLIRLLKEKQLKFKIESNHIHISGEEHDTPRDNHPSGINDSGRSTEAVVKETRLRADETPTDDGGFWSDLSGKAGNKEQYEQTLYLDTSFYSGHGSSFGFRVAETCPISGSGSGLWVDGVQSRVLVLYRW